MIFIAALTFSQIAKAGNKQAGSDFEPTSMHGSSRGQPGFRVYRAGGMHLAFCLWKGSGGLGSLAGGGGSEVSSGGGGGGQVMCLGV